MTNYNILEEPDYSLPFFAYGIFKPNELAYWKIKEFVQPGREHECHGKGIRLKSHDGIPIAEKCEYSIVHGCEITFSNPREAYRAFQDMELGRLYKWGCCTDSQDNKCNILLGNEEALKHGHPEVIHGDKWSRQNDPLFSKGLEYLRHFYFDKILVNKNVGPELIRRERKYIDDKINESFYTVFELQKAYIFLFTILDRLCTMKFGLKTKDNHDKIRKLSTDKDFNDFLEEYGDKIIKYLPRNVNSSLMGNYVLVNVANRDTIIDVFYQIRNNCVHTGKALDLDKFLLAQGFVVLFAVVWYIVKVNNDKRDAIDSLLKSEMNTICLV